MEISKSKLKSKSKKKEVNEEIENENENEDDNDTLKLDQSNYIDDNIIKRKIYKINDIGTDKLYIFDGNNSNKKIYNEPNSVIINSFIEDDDNINTVKNKIAKYLNIPPNLQYLFITDKEIGKNRGIVTNIKDINYLCGKSILDYVGHAFQTKKILRGKKGSPTAIKGDKLIQFPLNPFDANETHDSSKYFIKLDSKEFVKLNDYNLEDTFGMTVETILGESDTFNLITFDYYINKSKLPITDNFRYGHLIKYWPELVNDDKKYKNALDTTIGVYNDNLTNIIENVTQDELTIKVVNNATSIYKSQPTFNHSCITEIIIKVNYNESGNDFVDLSKIYSRIELNDELPFIKFKDDTISQDEIIIPKHRFYTPATKFIPQNVVEEWISKKTMNTDEIIKITGKGLSLKFFTYKLDKINAITKTNEYKYGSLNIYRDGRIEIKTTWEESYNNGKGANLSDVKNIIDYVKVIIDKINNIEYQYDGFRHLKIISPEYNSDNTSIAFMNTLTKCSFEPINSEINYSELNDFALYFGTYVSVIRKNIQLENIENKDQKYISGKDSSLQLRYKRVDGYLKMNDINKFINNILTHTYNVTPDIIVELLSEKFRVLPEQAKKIYEKYTIDFNLKNIETERKGKFSDVKYVLSKLIKHPGVDIKIQGADSSNYKIFITGVKTTIEMTRIINFIKSLLILYHNIKDVKKDEIFNQIKTSDIIDADKEALQNIEEAKKITIEDNENWFVEDVEDLFADEEIENANENANENENDKSYATEIGIEQEEIEKKAPVKKELFDISKEISPLHRLKSADLDLFTTLATDSKTGYPRKCQLSSQPMVIDESLYIQKLNESKKLLKQNEEKLNTVKLDSEKEKIKNDINRLKYSIDVYENKGIVYRNNFYFCPIGYNYEEEQILDKNDVDKIDSNYVPKNIYVRKSDKQHLVYTGFVDTIKDAYNNKICLPCCYKNIKKSRIDECTKESSATKLSKGQLYTNISYILQQEKLFISPNRYGFLPPIINEFFNSNDKGLTYTNIIEGFDYYLRRGIQGGSFIAAIADSISLSKEETQRRIQNNISLSLSYDEIINLLKEKLTFEKFMSLKGGSLKVVFQDSINDDNNTIYERFLTFLSSKVESINEDFLWDYITSEGILETTGFNLFIFEKVRNNILLKCPLGFETKDIYNKNKKSLILFKYNNIYEIICNVYNTNGNIYAERYIKDKNIIDELFKLLSDCKSTIDYGLYTYERNLLLLNNRDKRVFSQPETLVYTVSMFDNIEKTSLFKEHNEYKIKSQFIDDYNKTSHLFLTNNVIIPIKPSGRDEKFTILKENDIIFPNADVTYDTLIAIDNEIGKTDNKKLGLEPLMYVTNNKNNINGFVLKNGLISEFNEISYDEYKVFEQKKGIKLINEILYYKDRYTVDIAISRAFWEVNKADDRILYVNARIFEDETYQRLRYEFSKYIINHKQELNSINEIVNMKIDIDEKRTKLTPIINNILNEITTDVPNKDLNMDTYEPPFVRKTCMNSKNCLADVHCSDNKGTCKLYINPYNLVIGKGTKNNINRYRSIIIDELITNYFTRTELLNDMVENESSNAIKNKEFQTDVHQIITDSSKEAKQILNTVYNPKSEYHKKLENIYDVIYKKNTQGESNIYGCSDKYEKLSIEWQKKLGGSDILYILQNNGTSECIFHGLSNALSQLEENENDIITIDDIKDKIGELIEKIPDEAETNRYGWQLLYDRYKYNFHMVDRRSEIIESLNDMKSFIKSPNYRFSTIDLIFISYIYNVKILMLTSRGYLGLKDDISRYIMCINSTTSNKNRFLIVYKTGYELYNVVVSNISSTPKYIYKDVDIPNVIYKVWLSKCGSIDNKPDIDQFDKIVFFLKESPVIRIVDAEVSDGSGNTYVTKQTKFINPITGNILEEQLQNAEVILTQEQKKISKELLQKDKELLSTINSNPLIQPELAILNEYKIPEHYSSENILVNPGEISKNSSGEVSIRGSRIIKRTDPGSRLIKYKDNAEYIKDIKDIDLGPIKLKYINKEENKEEISNIIKLSKSSSSSSSGTIPLSKLNELSVLSKENKSESKSKPSISIKLTKSKKPNLLNEENEVSEPTKQIKSLKLIK